MKNVAILVSVTLGFAGVALLPGWLIWGDDAFRYCGVALALCLVPAAATLLAIEWGTKAAHARLMAGLGSSFVRMVVSLGGGLAIHSRWKDAFPFAFLIWLLAFYLVVLGLEVWLLVRGGAVEMTTDPTTVTK